MNCPHIPNMTCRSTTLAAAGRRDQEDGAYASGFGTKWCAGGFRLISSDSIADICSGIFRAVEATNPASMNQVEKFIEILHARTHAKQCWNVGMMGSIGCSQPGMMPIHQEFSSNVLLLKGFRSPSTDDNGTSIDIIDYLLQAKPRTFAQKKHQLQEPPAGGWSAKPCVCAQLVKVVLCIYTYIYIYTTVWTDVCINIYAHTWTYEIWYDSILWLCALYAMPGRFGNKGCSSRVCGLNLWLQERIQKLHPRTPIKELVKYSSQQAGSSFYAHFAGNLPVHP